MRQVKYSSLIYAEKQQAYQIQRHHLKESHTARKLFCLKGTSYLFLQRGYLRVGENPAVEEVHKRLLYIPLFFLVLRMWGTLQLFFSLGVANENQNGCIPKPIQTIFFIFGILQVTTITISASCLG